MMSDTTTKSAAAPRKHTLIDDHRGRIQLLQAYAGLFLLAISMVAFGATIYVAMLEAQAIGPFKSDSGNVLHRLIENQPQIAILFAVSIITTILGMSLLKAAMFANAKTIPDEDREFLAPLISDANEKAIFQYVRLSGLTGSTGFFAKLGFTGLPLVTAALGILLILLAMLSSDPLDSELMDLAKLVIGAFIGSFVQKTVTPSGDETPPGDLM
jgi:hypothetical protein